MTNIDFSKDFDLEEFLEKNGYFSSEEMEDGKKAAKFLEGLDKKALILMVLDLYDEMREFGEETWEECVRNHFDNLRVKHPPE